MEKHLDPYANNQSDEAIASMRAEMEALANIVNDEESWPAYLDERVTGERSVVEGRGGTYTADHEAKTLSNWLSELEAERDHPFMTDLDTSPEFW